MKIYNRLFRSREHLEPSDLLEFDIITGSQKILGNISVYAPATIRDLTRRKTVTMKAPRLAEKRFIPVAALNALRQLGGKLAVESMKERIAREQKDIRGAEISQVERMLQARLIRSVVIPMEPTPKSMQMTSPL